MEFIFKSDALPTITQFTSPSTALVPMVATAVCATVFTARTAAAFAHCFQFFFIFCSFLYPVGTIHFMIFSVTQLPVIACAIGDKVELSVLAVDAHHAKAGALGGVLGFGVVYGGAALIPLPENPFPVCVVGGDGFIVAAHIQVGDAHAPEPGLFHKAEAVVAVSLLRLQGDLLPADGAVLRFFPEPGRRPAQRRWIALSALRHRGQLEGELGVVPLVTFDHSFLGIHLFPATAGVFPLRCPSLCNRSSFFNRR